MTLDEAERVVEALVLASPTPLTRERAASVLDTDAKLIDRLFERLESRYQGRGITLRRTAGGIQFATHPDLAEWISKLGRQTINTPLSPAALETLAIIAYEQPVTRGDIEKIRGVRSDSAVNTLLERELCSEAGRREGPGRPILYRTTDRFLLHFGLDTLEDLPERSSERIGEQNDEMNEFPVPPGSGGT